MAKICYECGKEIDNAELTKEHIPAKCLFTGYSDDFKKNRITVKAHRECNEKYSKIDQDIRDAIGIMTNRIDDKQDLSAAAIRSILQPRNGVERISSEDGKMFVEFDYDNLERLHIKHFKGIIMHEAKLPLPDIYKIQVIADGDGRDFTVDQVSKLYDAVDQTIPDWSFSGHSEIFKYKLCAYNDDGPCELDLTRDDQMIFCVMVFHEKLMSIAVATTEAKLAKIRADK